MYALTSAAEQRDKEALYSQLQALFGRFPRRDLLIVAGDWKGQTGPGNPTNSHLIGRFGLGSRCGNGERPLNLADQDRLLVASTCVQHCNKHLLIWYSGDGHTASQVDYILVTPRFRIWVHDSRSKRGAETGNTHGSDQFLVRTRLKVHLSSAPKMPRLRRIDVAEIRQTTTAEAQSREIRSYFTTRADRAHGDDGTPAEIYKSRVNTLASWLREVIKKAWKNEVAADDWGLGILVPILKKEGKTRFENYRGISLIEIAAKIFAIALLRRFQAMRDSRTRPNQAGFRAGRGCADQLFALRRILEFCHSCHWQPTTVCFVDFAVAFDSVHLESLWHIMALDGVPPEIIAMIETYSHPTTARVLVRNNLPQPFGVRSGVQQGCILPPILFNYAIDCILGRALHGEGVEFAPGHRMTGLDYVDNISLLASSFGDLQCMVSRVNEVAKSVGLSTNARRTKVFSSCTPDQKKAPLGTDGCQLEEVDSFKYLGARLLPNGQSKDEIVFRIDAARRVFASLRKCLWTRRDLYISTKIRVYRAPVRSVLFYSCECWAVRVEDDRSLQVFDHHCLRTILRVKYTDFVSNETVHARCDNITRMTQAIQERRLQWFGLVLLRPPQGLSVTFLNPAPLPH
ncbi:hypothetical protein SprV_0200828300 [Sparganum proliferum]